MNTASPRHLRHRGTRNIDLCHDCALLLPTPLATRRCDDIELGWCSPRSRHSAVSAPVCDNRTESRLPPAHHTRRATPEAYFGNASNFANHAGLDYLCLDLAKT